MTNELQQQLTEQQMSQRRSMGDNLQIAREVDHNAYFRKKPAAIAAGTALAALGYTFVVRRSRFKWDLGAHKSESLDGDNPNRFTDEVTKIVESNGGTYDGW